MAARVGTSLSTSNPLTSNETKKILKWLGFGALFGITPLITTYLFLIDQDPSKQISLVHVLQRGELYLVSAAIAAESLGDLIGTEKTHTKGAQNVKLICGSACTFVVFLASALFAELTITTTGLAVIDPEIAQRTTDRSIAFYISSIIAGLGSKLLGD